MMNFSGDFIDRQVIRSKVIVRSESSGFFFGTLVSKEGREVCLTSCQRLTHLGGDQLISNLIHEESLLRTKRRPINGYHCIAPADLFNPHNIVILDTVEIIPCSDEAIAFFEKKDQR